MDLYSLPDPLQELATGEIASGERVRWAGQPAPRNTFPWVALGPVLFAIPWTLFALFWMGGASGVLDFNQLNGIGQLDTQKLVFSLFGIPFVLIGLAMLSSPFWIRRRMRRAASRTAYIITDRRAIVLDGGYYGDGFLGSLLGGVVRLAGQGIRVSSYGPDKLEPVQRVQREDGSGDMIFGEVRSSSEDSGRLQLATAGFFSIPDVKEVEDLLKSLAESGKKAKGQPPVRS